MLKNPTKPNKDKYSKYRNKLNSTLIAAEKCYYASRFTNCFGNMKSTWKLINELTKDNIRPALNEKFIVGNNTITDPFEIANHFNKFFVNIGSELAKKIPIASQSYQSYLRGSHMDSFSLFPVTESEILNIVNNLNDKMSAGTDEIPLHILKKSLLPIVSILTELINDSFQNGFFPDELKIAKVCPIFKSGCSASFSNYRPISILSSFSKIYERAMQNRLLKFLMKNDVLGNNQYGFRKNHSTYMALLEMYDKLSLGFDENKITIALFIDLQKAFDSISHDILLYKLHHYGIRGLAYQWFEDYLRNRTQLVIFNSIKSDLGNILWGVPQGSILGPILFLIYITDIVNCSSVLNFILFADDTNAYFTGNCLDEVFATINVEIVKLTEWLNANKLSLNISKTNYMLFGSKSICKPNVPFHLTINNVKIERITNVKFLGVLIDDNLSWKNHVEYVSSKISKCIGVIYRIKNLIDSNTLKLLYHAMIEPYLSYCIIVWGGANPTTLYKLVTLQKRALRLLNRSSYLAHCEPLFKKSEILTLADMYRKEVALFMFKFKYNMLPECCKHFITTAAPVSLYNLRKNPLHFVITI